MTDELLPHPLDVDDYAPPAEAMAQLAATNGTPSQDEAPSKVSVIRSKLMTTPDLRTIPPPEPLIDGWLYLDSVAMLYGPSGVGKSFIAIDFAMTVASRRQWWNGNAVTNGTVLYVIAEGAAGVGMRTHAWESHHDETGAVTWLPHAVNIFEPGWAEALATVVAELRPLLVVVDTFARSIVGADENSARDIGQAVANLDRLRLAAGSCVLIVHHSGKDINNGGRGSSALKGALDTEIELTGDSTRMRLKNSKQKNAVESAVQWFKLLGCEQSAVVVQAGDESDDDLSAGAFATLELLESIGLEGGVSLAVWRETAVEAGIAKASFYRHVKRLSVSRFVENVGTDKRPAYRAIPKDE